MKDKTTYIRFEPDALPPDMPTEFETYDLETLPAELRQVFRDGGITTRYVTLTKRRGPATPAKEAQLWMTVYPTEGQP